MKTLVNLFAAAILFSNCSSMQQTASTNSDDVYASAKDKPSAKVSENKTTVAAPTNPEQFTSQEEKQPNSTAVEQDEKGNTYITNKYYDSDFDYDDYYDYEYAVRMKRFYHPVSNYGYYDNYYSNSYWYSGNPHHWGLSVYLGYNWWGPSYYSYNYYPQSYSYAGWGAGYGWNNGWGYNGWGGNNCGNGWGYGGGYGYGHNNGYNNGYWDGYWNGYYNGMANNNNYYYNSYDNSGNYYGPRGNTTHSNGVAISSHGKKYEAALASTEMNSFTPVSGVNSFNSDPRPINPNTNMNSLPAPKNGTGGKGNTSDNPYTSDPRSVNPNSGHSEPKGNRAPKSYDPPKSNDTPKGYDKPKSSGGNSGGGHKGGSSSSPSKSSGGGKHR